MTQTEAEKRARELFPTGVLSVKRYTEAQWRDGGAQCFRVTMGDKERTLHWMTRTGRHEKEICCKEQRATKAVASRPVVVKR